MRKNLHGRILKDKSKEYHLSIVPKFHPYQNKEYLVYEVEDRVHCKLQATSQMTIKFFHFYRQRHFLLIVTWIDATFFQLSLELMPLSFTCHLNYFDDEMGWATQGLFVIRLFCRNLKLFTESTVNKCKN